MPELLASVFAAPIGHGHVWETVRKASLTDMSTNLQYFKNM